MAGGKSEDSGEKTEGNRHKAIGNEQKVMGKRGRAMSIGQSAMRMELSYRLKAAGSKPRVGSGERAMGKEEDKMLSSAGVQHGSAGLSSSGFV